jgi:hypothetical protein
MTPEAKVKADIRKMLTARGVWFAGRPKPAFVWGWMYIPVAAPFGVHGIADFCGIVAGKPFYIEAKAPGGKPTSNQLDRQQEVIAAGGHSIIVESEDEVTAYFRNYGFI